jgi:hypothetical protein
MAQTTGTIPHDVDATTAIMLMIAATRKLSITAVSRYPQNKVVTITRSTNYRQNILKTE